MRQISTMVGTEVMAAVFSATAAVPASTGGTKDIVETAVGAGNFTIMAKALQATGLVETLKGKGPYTVFAPTDEAFAKLPAGTVEVLLKDTEKLKAILLYHVVTGRVTAQDVVKLDSAKTVGGASVRIMANNGSVMIDGAKVVGPDVSASNGVIHVIDSVLIPSR
jgi:uncharacterized surface protein with fasciclin (FAS1) repeats